MCHSLNKSFFIKYLVILEIKHEIDLQITLIMIGTITFS